ncbi:hypothetical protein ACPOM7_24770 [Peribacillus castrilensis]|uniref:DUF1440 domain-containing protein n=1 Tax=Peribacillus simplex TaxID=1478 RepID=A0AAN2TS13_9BACI|nr:MULTISPECIES: hypothetical protein [Bacillaceae]MCP1095360.1 hypothetical protein [Bacillaceae bacterium OS4b]MBD8588856.1 hypothetical protein [Peribacillus simplex]MCF7621616.1 hypothetical protein [Peribacillus frigoritolerans]MCP1152276.1 hypothetical protein [Peribacillus frigoritolerans]MCT1387452.1 hypothetical protein [Peribacillus frigoritolerans]
MKMNGRTFHKVTLIGLINGLLLGWIMKWVEMLSGKQVYKLLLNVDFLPLIGAVSWSEESLFFFHLLFSLAITYSYVYILHPLKAFRKWNKYALAFITIIPAIMLYFPLSALSKTEVVLPSDLTAFFLWTILHLFYGLSLPKAI